MVQKRSKKSEIGHGETPAEKSRRRPKKAGAPDSKAAAAKQPELFAVAKPETGGKRRRKPSPPKKTAGPAQPPAQAQPAESTALSTHPPKAGTAESAQLLATVPLAESVILEGASTGTGVQLAAPTPAVVAARETESVAEGEAAKPFIEQLKSIPRPPLEPEEFAPVEGPPPQTIRLGDSNVAYAGMKRFDRPLPNRGMSGLMKE